MSEASFLMKNQLSYQFARLWCEIARLMMKFARLYKEFARI